jgi:hypothetical protein
MTPPSFPLTRSSDLWVCAAHEHGDVVLVDVEVMGDGDRLLSSEVPLDDLLHVLWSEFEATMAPTSVDHVLGVVLGSSSDEMSDLIASRFITGVPYHWRQVSVFEPENKPMEIPDLAVKPDLPVPSRGVRP